MKKIFVLTVLTILLSACGGTAPPEWWDPAHKYTAGAPQTQPSQPVKQQPAAAKPAAQKPVEAAPEDDGATFAPVETVEIETVTLQPPSILEE